MIKLSLYAFQTELDKLLASLQLLKDRKSACLLSSSTASRITAIQEMFKQQNGGELATHNGRPGELAGKTELAIIDGNHTDLGGGRRVSVKIRNGQVINCDTKPVSAGSAVDPAGLTSPSATTGRSRHLGSIGGAIMMAEATVVAAVTMANPEGVTREKSAGAANSLSSPGRASCKSLGSKGENDDEDEADGGEEDSEGNSYASSSCCTYSSCSYCQMGNRGNGDVRNATTGPAAPSAAPAADVKRSCSMGSECTFYKSKQPQSPTTAPAEKSRPGEGRENNSAKKALTSPNEAEEDVVGESEKSPGKTAAKCGKEGKQQHADAASSDPPVAATHFSSRCSSDIMHIDSCSDAADEEDNEKTPELPAPPTPVAAAAATKPAETQVRQRKRKTGVVSKKNNGGEGGSSAVGAAGSASRQQGNKPIVLNLDDKNRFTDEVTV